MHRVGEMLQARDRATGGEAQKTRFQIGTELPPPTLAESGLSKKESARAQKLAALPEDNLQAIKDRPDDRQGARERVARIKTPPVHEASRGMFCKLRTPGTLQDSSGDR
jgi:hypothetical protein